MRSARCSLRERGTIKGEEERRVVAKERELADYSIRDELSVSGQCISGEQIRVIRGASLSRTVSHSTAKRYSVCASVPAGRPLNSRSGTGLEQRGPALKPAALSRTERYFLSVGTKIAADKGTKPRIAGPRNIVERCWETLKLPCKVGLLMECLRDGLIVGFLRHGGLKVR